MNRRKLLSVGATVALVGGMMASTVGLVLAAGPGQSFFELDASSDLGDGSAPKSAITDHGAGLPDDWDRVVAGTSGASATSYDTETTAAGGANNATIFTGGGSKDQQPISQWGWKDATGGLPDKDNLLHALSAKYGAGATAHIYFAADRFDNSGDAQIGFWFFNNPVAPAAGGGFSGSHKAGVVPHDPANAGDILILSDFTNGGTQPTIRVFEYVGSGGSDGSLNLLGGNATDIRDCATVTSDSFCGSVNNYDGAEAPYLWLNKSGQSTYGHGEFYEGGLNLTTLGLQNECFSSFMAETRSSQSVTATLKDFVAGPFQNCTAGVVTTPKDGSGASIPAAGLTIEADGAMDVKDSATVTVGGAATWSGTVSFFLCGPIASPDLCTTGGVPIGAAKAVNQGAVTAVSDAASVTSAGRYCWRGVFTSATNGVPNSTDATAGECFTVNPRTPTLTTSASADVVLGSPVTDTATLGNTAKQPGTNGGTIPGDPASVYPSINATNGALAGGTITFVLNTSACAASGRPVTPTGGVLDVSGDAQYGPVSATPNAIGTYYWVATYSGNGPNTGTTAGSCPPVAADGDETVVVTGTSSFVTAQNWLPNDSATLTGSTNLTGTLTFTLFDNATCTPGVGNANVKYTQVIPVANAATGTTFSTTNGAVPATTFKATASGSYSWLVQYNDDNLSDPSDSCKEDTSLTLDNVTAPAP